MTVLAVIQARMGSVRLPGKVLMDLAGKPILQHVIERAKRAAPVIVTTTLERADDAIEYLAWECEVPCVRYGTGRTTPDVYGRFCRVLKHHHCKAFLRLTGDNPLIEPAILRAVVNAMQIGYGDMRCIDHMDASERCGYADGLDCEGVRTATFLAIPPETLSAEEREHVTLHMVRHPERFKNCVLMGGPWEPYQRDPEQYRLTVDTQRDLDRLRRMAEDCGCLPDAMTALLWLSQHPEWLGD